MQPNSSYGAPVWDAIGKTLSEKLQKLQNRANRVVTVSPYDISSRSLLDELNRDTLSTMRLKQKANLMFNIDKRTPLVHSIYNKCFLPERMSII